MVCWVFYKNGGGRYKYVLYSGLDFFLNNFDFVIFGYFESFLNFLVNEDGDCDIRVKGVEREVIWMGGFKLGVSIIFIRLKFIVVLFFDINILLYN